MLSENQRVINIRQPEADIKVKKEHPIFENNKHLKKINTNEGIASTFYELVSFWSRCSLPQNSPDKHIPLSKLPACHFPLFASAHNNPRERVRGGGATRLL